MQQEKTNNKNKNTALAVLFWILSGVCFILIFYFSSRTRSESTVQSTFLTELFIKIFGINAGEYTEKIIRKCAHFVEFTGTASVVSAAVYFTLQKNRLYIPVIITSLYAVTDEIHQIYVPGRSCEFRDWVIDTAGAVLGTAIFLVIYRIIIRIKHKNSD